MTRHKSGPLSPWQELEEQAYHAYREWPLFLKLRLRELRTHLPPEVFAGKKRDEQEAIAVDLASVDSVSEDIALLKEYGLFVPESAAYG